MPELKVGDKLVRKYSRSKNPKKYGIVKYIDNPCTKKMIHG